MRKVTTEEKLIRIHDAVVQLMERREATDISMYDVAKSVEWQHPRFIITIQI